MSLGLNEITSIPAWVSNRMSSRVWVEVIYPFPNINGCTISVWKWISNFIPHFIMDVIIYPCWDYVSLLTLTVSLLVDKEFLLGTITLAACAIGATLLTVVSCACWRNTEETYHPGLQNLTKYQPVEINMVAADAQMLFDAQTPQITNKTVNTYH